MAAGWSARITSSSSSGNLVICSKLYFQGYGVRVTLDRLSNDFMSHGGLLELLEYHWYVDQRLVLYPQARSRRQNGLCRVEGLSFSPSSKAI